MGETEARRDGVTCPVSRRKRMLELGFELGQPGSRSRALSHEVARPSQPHYHSLGSSSKMTYVFPIIFLSQVLSLLRDLPPSKDVCTPFTITPPALHSPFWAVFLLPAAGFFLTSKEKKVCSHGLARRWECARLHREKVTTEKIQCARLV